MPGLFANVVDERIGTYGRRQGALYVILFGSGVRRYACNWYQTGGTRITRRYSVDQRLTYVGYTDWQNQNCTVKIWWVPAQGELLMVRAEQTVEYEQIVGGVRKKCGQKLKTYIPNATASVNSTQPSKCGWVLLVWSKSAMHTRHE